MDTGPNGKARRRPIGQIERLETRELPTAPSLLAGTSATSVARKIASLVGSDVGAMPQDASAPTAHELARERFVAKFTGSFIVGPGRFTDQSSQAFIKGAGTSSAFLHGNLQMAVYTPKDPASGTSGIAALIVKNVSNSGNLLVLDLVGDAQSVDSGGRPTQFTWTIDASSGGTFSGATGQGTVEIHYQPEGSLPPRARSAGQAAIIFQGLIQTNGVTNVLRT